MASSNSQAQTPKEKRTKPYFVPKNRLRYYGSVDESFIASPHSSMPREIGEKWSFASSSAPPSFNLDEETLMESPLMINTDSRPQTSSPASPEPYICDQPAQIPDPDMYMDTENNQPAIDETEAMDYESTPSFPPSKKGNYAGFCKRLSRADSPRLRVITISQYGAVRYVAIQNIYPLKLFSRVE